MVSPLLALNTIKKFGLRDKVPKVHQNFIVDATPQNPQPCKILWRSVKMPEIYAINLCSQKKWAKVHQKFLGDATP